MLCGNTWGGGSCEILVLLAGLGFVVGWGSLPMRGRLCLGLGVFVDAPLCGDMVFSAPDDCIR